MDDAIRTTIEAIRRSPQLSGGWSAAQQPGMPVFGGGNGQPGQGLERVVDIIRQRVAEGVSERVTEVAKERLRYHLRERLNLAVREQLGEKLREALWQGQLGTQGGMPVIEGIVERVAVAVAVIPQAPVVRERVAEVVRECVATPCRERLADAVRNAFASGQLGRQHSGPAASSLGAGHRPARDVGAARTHPRHAPRERIGDTLREHIGQAVRERLGEALRRALPRRSPCCTAGGPPAELLIATVRSTAWRYVAESASEQLRERIGEC